jgi:hypothetical protein
MSPVKYELGFYIPVDDNLHSHCRENLKSHIALTGWPLWWCNVSPVKYELGFYIPVDDNLHSHCRENLKSHIALTGWPLWWCNMSPVKYELGFYIPVDDNPHSHSRENLKSHIVPYSSGSCWLGEQSVSYDHDSDACSYMHPEVLGSVLFSPVAFPVESSRILCHKHWCRPMNGY